MAHDDLQTSVVFAYTDGGSDHMVTMKAVQLSLIALYQLTLTCLLLLALSQGTVLPTLQNE